MLLHREVLLLISATMSGLLQPLRVKDELARRIGVRLLGIGSVAELGGLLKTRLVGRRHAELLMLDLAVARHVDRLVRDAVGDGPSRRVDRFMMFRNLDAHDQRLLRGAFY
jgi:hypothetical protein